VSTTAYRVASQAQGFRANELIQIEERCASMASDCAAQGDTECQPAYACVRIHGHIVEGLKAVIQACRLAEIAVIQGQQETADEHIAQALLNFGEIVTELRRYGAL